MKPIAKILTIHSQRKIIEKAVSTCAIFRLAMEMYSGPKRRSL